MKRNLSKLLPLFVMAMFSFAKSAQASEIYHSVQNGASEGEVIAYAGGYTKVSSLSFLDIYLGDGAANWTAKNTLSEESFVGQDGVSYSTAYVQGGTNGMKGHLIHGNGMSAHVKLVPSGDGTVYIAAKYAATKPIWAAKVPNNSVPSLNMADMTPYLIPGFSEAIATDTGIVMTKAMYINDAGTGLQESTASANTYATLPLQVEAGYTYYFWASGSKIMLCGINANEISAPKPTSYPTSTDLARYYTPGQLCVAIYFRGKVCNDVIFVGTYNNWSTTPNQCAKFQPVVGFDGWYVVAVTDNSSNIEGRPVQLANDGSFSWIYQTGDADSWTLVSGYVSISAGGSGESNLTNYDTSTPVILISDYFKNHNSPCGDVRHTYTVNLKAPICGNFTPAIIGDFNQWATGIAMTYDAATGTYSHSFTGNEGESFKFLACGYDDWSNELLIYQDGSWIPNPDITLTDQLTYTLDYSEGKYALCEEEMYIFTYDIVNGEAILTGYNGTLPESVEIPATITIGNTLYDVTSIGERAFSGCSSLTSITIPNSVTKIGNSAFSRCSSLTSITIPNSVTSIGNGAFWYCSSLTSITIPNSVTSIGGSAFAYCSSLTSIILPNSVTSIGERAFASCSSLTSITLPNSVTSIGYEAFYNCSSLTSITLPNSVTSIGEEAFLYCSSLTSITLPNSVTSIGKLAFGGCSSLTSLTLPNSVTSIEYGAFLGCSSLTSLTIPNSVTSIGERAFSSCSSLTSIVVESGNTMYDSRENCSAIIETATNTLIVGCQSTIIPNSVTSIGYEAFYDCSSLTSITIPNSVISIEGSAFSGCSSLTSLTIPNSVTSIGDGAFAWCSSLTSITIPNSVASIGDWAFSGVPNIVYNGTATGSPWGARSVNGYVEGYLVYADETKTYLLACSAAATGEITLPNSVTSIGEWAFNGCFALTSITIGNSVTSIGENAFYDCSSLTSITIPNSVTSIGSSAFSGCTSLPIVDNLRYADTYLVKAVDKSLSTYNIKTGTKWIGDDAFSYCDSLTSITIPNSVTSIGERAFSSCSSLTSITIPNSVTSIGNGAFWYCPSLTSITIPNSVTSIGKQAFRDCSALTSITIPNSVTSIGENAFYDCSSLTSVTIGNSVTSIGSSAFNGCYSLTSVTIPNSVTSIGDDAFQNCKGLTEFTIPENITYLGDEVFEGCSGITSITWNAKRCQDRWKDVYYYSQLPFYDIYSQISSFTFGKTVDSIPSLLCYEMSNLSSITIPENVKHIGGGVFSNCTGLTSVAWNAINCSNDVGDGSGSIWLIFKNANAHITSFTIGEKVEVIPGKLCYGLSELTSITIPNSVKTIGSHAFRDCSGLTAIGIPENVTSIEYSTFSGCTALASVIIPSSVTMIDEYAFGECLKLRDVYCYPATPPTAQINSFANYDVYVHVPCASLDAYDMDVVFGSFKYLECIGAEDTVITDKTVTVVPGDADATFTWPVTDNAETYSLVIAKDGVTFCTLVFNAQGQLLSIAFKPRRQNAPAAEGITPATYAEMTANGFRFTVTGLDEGTAYAYTLTVRNAANTVLETYTGDFTTLSNTPTGINESAGEDAHAAGQVEKIIRDGQVLILRNGVTYDMMGNML